MTTLLVVVGLLLGYLATYRGKAQLPTLEQLTLNITRERIKGQFLVKLRNHVPLNLQIDSLSYTAHVDGKQLA